ncbi:MAG TPA: hypothetical protein VFJ06_06915 [Halococcus sp.]|nr:hypothetical protein [Halococcus sp.]
MNTNVVAVVFVSVLLCGVVGVSVTPQSGTTAIGPRETAAQTTDESLGGDISVFMQRGVAATNGSVDSGMWLAAFESAENQSRKETLVAQRAETLGARLDRLEERIAEFRPTKTNRTVAHRARWARLAADRDALRTSISEAKTAAASAGVNASGLDKLSRRAENLSMSNATPNRTGHNATATASSRTPAANMGLRADGTTYRGP